MPGADTTTRVVAPPCDDLELAERIALFALMTRRPRVESVLDGLTKAAAIAAKNFANTASSWSSGKRQGRAALDFGPRGDQHERLARLITEADPALRLALYAHMTPQQQARFPQLAGRESPRLPGLAAFAARLVREASR